MLNNVLKLIGPARKKKLFGLIIMMFFGSLLEMLGIAMIMEVFLRVWARTAAGRMSGF